MSLVTEILDRLTGLAAVKAQLDTTAADVRRLADWMLDHEKRVLRIEAGLSPKDRAPRRSVRLPRK
ncbi:MAG: hypothetical protein ACKVQU_03855 [Burkholderiales bacterium]